MKNYKIDFIEMPDSLNANEMIMLKGGTENGKCFIYCDEKCKTKCGCKKPKDSGGTGYSDPTPQNPSQK